MADLAATVSWQGSAGLPCDGSSETILRLACEPTGRSRQHTTHLSAGHDRRYWVVACTERPYTGRGMGNGQHENSMIRGLRRHTTHLTAGHDRRYWVEACTVSPYAGHSMGNGQLENSKTEV